ncbi:PREDICTED: uncharacterized protein LOC109463383 isoform X2 [Branchiostoma belcheri]|uniref:Uncharacterized protein LOC109463383 isoform X2 n=1 Tax=Branchiostoma belcheri TaxID=7741 RepID=A0A6P4YAA1_BRABE|nr:PREDICTED: uncharacterized protein LOC109463383 isoform X2 [Branchiostoma belcheri]
MKLTVCVVLLVVLVLLLPDESAGWWRRRRRRHCSRVNCAWGNWGSWGACTAQCGATGTRTRTRIVATHAQCGGSGCSGSSSETQPCNRGCPNGTPSGPRCICTGTGFTGTCCNTDIDECRDGSHTCNSEHGVCTNTEGSYTCRCDTGYAGDGRTCISTNAGTGWQRVSGGLKFVSVGRSGVWGVNRNDQIYYRTGTYRDEASAGSGWVRIDGALKQISSGDNIVWGVNSNDDIYIRQGICWYSPGGTSWRNIPGKLKQVHVSPTSNQVWGVNSGNNIYRRTGITASNPAGTGWQNIGGQLKFVSVGRAGVWGVNSNDQIYYRTGTSGNENVPGTGWERVSGSLKLISSGNGVVWGVNSNNQIYVRAAACPPTYELVAVNGNNKCLRFSARGDRKNYQAASLTCRGQGARLVVIKSAALDTFIDNRIRTTYAAETWIGLDDLTAPSSQYRWSDGSVLGARDFNDWSRGQPDTIYREKCVEIRPQFSYHWNNHHCNLLKNYICEIGARPGTSQGSSWYRIGGSLTGVHISSSSNQVWGVNSANNIYRRQGITPVSPKCEG